MRGCGGDSFVATEAARRPVARGRHPVRVLETQSAKAKQAEVAGARVFANGPLASAARLRKNRQMFQFDR